MGNAPLTVCGVALLGGTLGLVRSAPRAAWAGAVAGLVLMVPEGSQRVAAVYVLVPAHAFCAGRQEPFRWSVAAVAALAVSWELGVVLGGGWGGPAALLTVVAWVVGRALRDREELMSRMAVRARELDEERTAHAALSARYERARIASELHDIVAHALSVMVVQAGAGQRLAARDPVGTADAFRAIQGAARQAEQDMGRLVTLLADRDALGPTPDVALVEDLVARAAGSGLDVTLRLEGDCDGLPPATAEAAYHVVQEGLTNALRYAAGAAVLVRLHGDQTALTVEVTNAAAGLDDALAGTGTGTGLTGLRERVGAIGGMLEAGAADGGGWRVRARLPRRVAAPSPE